MSRKITVTANNGTRKAGNYLKLLLSGTTSEGEINFFSWISSEEEGAKIVPGNVLEGDLVFNESKNPAYEGEYQLKKWKVIDKGSAPTQVAAPTQSAPVSGNSNGSTMARQNACKVAGSVMSGKGMDDPGKFWAAVRQINEFTVTGVIPLMSTKEQHEAILALFTTEKDGKRVPDVDAARDAVNERFGVPYMNALTMQEAADFLESMTPDLPS
jgi:hypothetical protein